MRDQQRRRLAAGVALILSAIAAVLLLLGQPSEDMDPPQPREAVVTEELPVVTLPVPARPPDADPVRLTLVDAATPGESANSTATAAPPKVAVVVVDSEESPIPDAEITGRELRARLRTDQNGYVAMTAAETRPREAASFLTVKVSAYDFCAQTVELPLPAPSLTSVTLVRAAWLDARLVDVAGPIAALMQVELSDGAGRRRFAVDETGRCLINALQPDAPIAVSVLDRYGTTVGSPQSVTLAPGEHRRVDLVLGFDPRSLVVTVRDELGAPVADARVGLIRAGDKHREATTEIVEKTDGSGRALFSGLCLSRVDVQAVASAHGFALERGIELVTQSTFIELDLGPAMPVEVRVLDGAGQPRAPDFVGVLDLPLPVEGEALAFGRYRLSGLPRGEVRLSALHQDRRWDVLHETQTPSATLTIDTLCRLTVRCDVRPVEVEDFDVLLQVHEPGFEPIRRRPTSGRIEGSTAVLEFDDLLPGEMRVCLVQWSIGGPQPITEEAPVTITAGSTASVTLRRL